MKLLEGLHMMWMPMLIAIRRVSNEKLDIAKRSVETGKAFLYRRSDIGERLVRLTQRESHNDASRISSDPLRGMKLLLARRSGISSRKADDVNLTDLELAQGMQ